MNSEVYLRVSKLKPIVGSGGMLSMELPTLPLPVGVTLPMAFVLLAPPTTPPPPPPLPPPITGPCCSGLCGVWPRCATFPPALAPPAAAAFLTLTTARSSCFTKSEPPATPPPPPFPAERVRVEAVSKVHSAGEST